MHAVSDDLSKQIESKSHRLNTIRYAFEEISELPEYILAMKLMAMRLDETAGKSDLEDIINLLGVVELATPEAAIDFASGLP